MNFRNLDSRLLRLEAATGDRNRTMHVIRSHHELSAEAALEATDVKPKPDDLYVFVHVFDDEVGRAELVAQHLCG